MSFYENLESFKGRPVIDWSTEVTPADFETKAIRIRVDYGEADEGVTIAGKLAELAESKGSEQIESLVIGTWEPQDSGADSAALVEGLVSLRTALPRLRHLFIGDITSEENECSWIRQSDLSALLAAYPKLEHLTVRGGENLTFGSALRHDHLRELVVQAGGLPPSVIHEIAAAKLPGLQHLELWLGEPNYGGDATAEDLAPLLGGRAFPKLRYLGLKNSVIQDEVAGLLALAPILDQLETLDLSQGTLSDEGARALLAGPGIRKLKRLDLRHHFMSKAMTAQLQGLGIAVNVDDAQAPHEWGGEEHRFIAVSE